MAIGIVDFGDPYALKDVAFWPGVPLLLAGMEKVGLATSAGFVALNIVCIIAGITAAWKVMADDDSKPVAWACALATAGSWLVIKHSTVSMTDIPCMASIMIALVYYTRSSHWGRPGALGHLAAAAGFSAAACLIRPNAIALFGSVIVVIFLHPAIRTLIERMTATKPKALATAVLILLASITAFAVAITAARQTAYGRDLVRIASGNGEAINFLATTLTCRAEDSTPTFLNIPARAIPDRLLPLARCLGAWLFLSALVTTTCRLWKQPRPSDAFLLGFLSILAIWPYSDPRFFIPALPLLFRAWFLPLRKYHPAFTLCLGLVFFTGTLTAFIYSSAITFSTEDFPAAYSHELENSYRAARGLPPTEGRQAPIPEAVELIRRYGDSRTNPLAKPSRKTRQSAP